LKCCFKNVLTNLTFDLGFHSIQFYPGQGSDEAGIQADEDYCAK